jgi:esterase
MKLFYRKYGEGYPLVILHGLFGISDNWNSLAKYFGAKYEVYTPDLRNHGQSPHSPDFDYTVMSSDIAEFLDDHSLEDAFLIGHSMGGKVAMRFAFDHPERVRKLIVADIGPKYYAPHHKHILDALYSVDLNTVKSRKEAEERMSEKIGDFSVRQFLLKNLYWKTPESLAWRMNLDVISDNIGNVGESIDGEFDKPALFIRGGLSGYVLDSDWPQIEKQFPDSALVTLEGAGHWVHAEQPEQFVKAVEDFLNG